MQPKENPTPGKRPEDSKPSPGAYARYTGLAFQMLATILAFTYAGYRLDQLQENSLPIWTLILSLVAIAASLYRFIRGAGQ